MRCKESQKKKKYKWLQQHEISEQNRSDRRSKKKNHSGSVGMRVNGRFSGTVKEGENWWFRDRKLRQRVLLLLISGVRRRWREEIRPITRIIHKILDTDGTNLELSSKGTDVTKNCIVWPACVRAICPSWHGLVAKLHLWQELQIQLRVRQLQAERKWNYEWNVQHRLCSDVIFGYRH